ncbi:MAG: energy transducer TonB [Nitrospiraceae bacterium]|nr:energy transducer TonB [Nitrospiraceae bacterium]
MRASFSFSLLFHVAVIMAVFFIRAVSWQNENKPIFFVTLSRPGYRIGKAMPSAEIEKKGKSGTIKPESMVKTAPPEARRENQSVQETGLTDRPVFPISRKKAFLDSIPSGTGIQKKEGLTDRNAQDHASSLSNKNAAGAADSKKINSQGRAGSGGLPTQVLKDGYVNEHLDYIMELIGKNLKYPLAARKMGWTGKVVIAFIISVDGHVCNVRIIKTSGYSMLDDNAVNTIKKISLFPKPRVNVELTIPITYRLE